jgi:hypothetical protein
MAKVRHGYSGDVGRMLGVSSKVAREVWTVLSRRADLDTNKLYMSQVEIAKDLNKTTSQISNAFKVLREAELIRLNKNKEIFFNPYVLFFAEFDNDDDEWMEAFNGEDVVYPLPMHKEWGHPDKELKEMETHEVNR